MRTSGAQLWGALAFAAMLAGGCAAVPAEGAPGAVELQPGGGGAAPASGVGGVATPGGGAGTAGAVDPAGSLAPGGATVPGGGGAGSAGGSGASGTAGSSGALAPGAGSGGVAPGGGLAPLLRADGFADFSPPLGEALPPAPTGQWTWVDLPAAKCRDGSSSGLYVRYSATSDDYFVYLEGGGVCLDDFFCGINPASVNETMNAESVLAGATGLLPVKQMPLDEGIFKQDPANPVKDWNAVYVPYCTGDIWGGTRKDGTFPPEEAGGLHTGGTHQFVGFDTTGVVLGRVVPTFPSAKKVLLTGSSAGGIGALLNAHRLADLMRTAAPQARGFVVSDSAVPFADQYLEPCLQQKWRTLWGLDGAFPPDCTGCFNADGGGMATGLSDYFMAKFPDKSQVLGGLISSVDDEIIELFYSKGLDNCVGNPLYPAGRYQSALENFRDQVVDKTRFGTYFMPGTFHMHLWRARFYETNGTSMSIAQWLGRLLENEAVQVAPI